MEFEHLRKKGWSGREIMHAKRILAQAASRRSPRLHATLWALVLVFGLGAAGVALFLLPVFLFVHSAVSVILSLVLGACMGLLLCYALATLRIGRKHHLYAALFLISSSMILLLIMSHSLQTLFFVTAQASPFFISMTWAVGMSIPYAFDRRLHGSE